MSRSLDILGGVSILILLVFPGCRSSPNPAELAPVRLAVVTAPTLIQLPVMLAKQLRHFEQEGLDVRIEDLSSGRQVVQALLGGSADVVSGFCEPMVVAIASGEDMRVFTLLLLSPAQAVVVSPKVSRKMTSVRDLRGATVGVTGLGSGLEYYVRYLAVRNGLPPNDISPISIGAHAARVAALEQGRIDAAILGEPGLSLLRQRHPGLVVLADMTTKEGMQAFFGADSYPATAFFATSRWLKANPNLAHSLARAIKRTLAWLQSHTAEDIAGQIPAHLKGEDAVLYTEAVRKLLPWYSRDGMMPRDGVELLHQVVATSVEKVRSAKVDVSRLYTNEFVQ